MTAPDYAALRPTLRLADARLGRLTPIEYETIMTPTTKVA